MKKKSKLLTILLTLCLTLSVMVALGGTASATEEPANIIDVSYWSELEDAFYEAEPGDVVRLQKDMYVDAADYPSKTTYLVYLSLYDSITLDFNGHTLFGKIIMPTSQECKVEDFIFIEVFPSWVAGKGMQPTTLTLTDSVGGGGVEFVSDRFKDTALGALHVRQSLHRLVPFGGGLIEQAVTEYMCKLVVNGGNYSVDTKIDKFSAGTAGVFDYYEDTTHRGALIATDIYAEINGGNFKATSQGLELDGYDFGARDLAAFGTNTTTTTTGTDHYTVGICCTINGGNFVSDGYSVRQFDSRGGDYKTRRSGLVPKINGGFFDGPLSFTGKTFTYLNNGNDVVSDVTLDKVLGSNALVVDGEKADKSDWTLGDIADEDFGSMAVVSSVMFGLRKVSLNGVDLGTTLKGVAGTGVSNVLEWSFPDLPQAMKDLGYYYEFSVREETGAEKVLTTARRENGMMIVKQTIKSDTAKVITPAVYAELRFGSASAATDLTLFAYGFKLDIKQMTPVTITTDALKEGQKGTEYSVQLAYTGIGPVKWAKLGDLPDGLTLDENTGLISGMPTTDGTWNPVIYATNGPNSRTHKQLKLVIKPLDGGLISIDLPKMKLPYVGMSEFETLKNQNFDHLPYTVTNVRYFFGSNNPATVDQLHPGDEILIAFDIKLHDGFSYADNCAVTWRDMEPAVRIKDLGGDPAARSYGFYYTVDVQPSNIISKVELQYGTYPFLGEAQVNSAKSMTPGVVVDKVSWSPAYATFKAETLIYTITIDFSAEYGYRFADDFEKTGSVKFQNVSQEITPIKDASGNITGYRMSYAQRLTIPPVPLTTITGLTEPVVGATPGTTAEADVGRVYEIKWSPADAVFMAGKEYTVTMKVQGVFDENSTFTINGHQATVIDSYGSQFRTLSYTFPALEETSYVFPFIDVPETEWYFESVQGANELGLINGKTDTLYKPADNMTYAEAIKLAACMHQLYTEGEVTLKNGNPQWYYSYYDYCRENGIIPDSASAFEPGYSDLLPLANTLITRAQYALLFSRALPDEALAAKNTIPDDSLPDVASTMSVYDQAIYKLYRAGIVNGTDTKGTFKPDSNILRSEVAAILIRMMDPSVRVGAPSELGK